MNQPTTSATPSMAIAITRRARAVEARSVGRRSPGPACDEVVPQQSRSEASSDGTIATLTDLEAVASLCDRLVDVLDSLHRRLLLATLATARTRLLVAVVGLLALVIVGLLAMAMLVRRRGARASTTATRGAARAAQPLGRRRRRLRHRARVRARRWCAAVAAVGSRSRRRPRWCARRAGPSTTA